MWNYEEDFKDRKFIYPPRIADEKMRIAIKEIRKKETNKAKFSFKKNGEVLGYCMEIETTKGQIMTVNNWALYREFRKHRVNDGDIIDIEHLDKGVWKVSVVKKATRKEDLGKFLEEKKQNEEEPDIPF